MLEVFESRAASLTKEYRAVAAFPRHGSQRKANWRLAAYFLTFRRNSAAFTL